MILSRIKNNRYFYLLVFSAPVFIFQGALVCKLHRISNFNENFNFVILLQALFTAIFSSYLLRSTILKVIDKDLVPAKSLNKKNEYKAIKISFLYYIIAMILIYVASHKGILDYRPYLDQWALINQGLNPWIGTDNVYLPIHNIVAPLAAINNSLPKLFWGCFFLIPMYFSSIFPLNFKREIDEIAKLKIFLIFAFSPFCLLVTAYFGHNDTLVAGLIVLSLSLSISNLKNINSVLSGISLALATMVKIYPIFVAPLFVLRKRKIDITFFTSYLLSIISILSISIFHWGDSTLKSVFWATEMHSKHLSFFNFSRKILGLNLDQYSIYAMALVLLTVLFLMYKHKIDLLPAVILTSSSGFTFYKLGHPQFFLFFFAAAPMTIRYIYDRKLHKNRRLFISYLMWICYLNFYETFYQLYCLMTKGYSFYIRGFGAIPYILFSTLMLIEIIKLLKKDQKALSSESLSS
ncbi:hypothetical protein PMM1206 [Prochlorococcus marinus subsp. pastoris str. CCMP1986]|uniref:DUF2029 domain-containing protein n=1 Tax=Prochlorococcus marinus subsp. pastoris (strain CCMP1986 / NIES-2087 / MED4) TaxID=59919 RepID=Q7V0Q0_PROMP|nr:glycosyltransferase 87 family protein [Prochlorococcus marinus]KGF87235.1 hypothetical protein PROCH_0822 [Prochlorococcus marinus str. EQPAC1]CAE19665.1 hypothetical protein PMM1206 [Prochlorococcus marinus subsp. pastoris str. CCMP1986]